MMFFPLAVVFGAIMAFGFWAIDSTGFWVEIGQSASGVIGILGGVICLVLAMVITVWIEER